MSYEKTKLMNLEDGQTLLAAVDGKMSDLKSAIVKNNGELAQLPQKIGLTLYRAIPADTGHGLVDSTTRVTSDEFIPCVGDTVSISSGYYFRILYYNNGGYSSYATWTQSWTATSAFAPNGARIQVKKGSAGTDAVTAEEVAKVLTCYLLNVSNTMLVPSDDEIAEINQNMALKADISRVEPLEKIFPESYFQFVDLNTKTSNTLWNISSQTGNLIQQSFTGYTSYDPIILPAGTYACNRIYAGKTYIKYSSDDSVSTFADDFPHGGGATNYGRTFTINEAITLYLTTQDSENTQPMVVSGESVPSSFMPYGLHYTGIDKNIEVEGVSLEDIKNVATFDYSKYITAYIHNCQLVGNSNKGAKYTQIDMGSNCKRMMCRFKLRAVNSVNTGCITLITLKERLTNDNSPTNDIGHGSVHVTFTATNVQSAIFVDTNQVFSTITYSSPLVGDEETEYEIGMEFLGSNQLKLYLPDGTSQTVTDSRIDTYNGRYIIFEHYTQSFDEEDYPIVTEQMPQALITGFYCRCEENVELRDNFRRENGAVGTAPSGQVYRTWANRGSNPTIYDNV